MTPVNKVVKYKIYEDKDANTWKRQQQQKQIKNIFIYFELSSAILFFAIQQSWDRTAYSILTSDTFIFKANTK